MDNSIYSPRGIQETYGSPQAKLKTFAESLQKSGSPTARPDNWFINTGTKKVQVKPAAGSAKWLCTMLLRKHIITWKQFYMMARGHALAIFMFPNFAYWYLRFAGEIVDRADLGGHEWKYFPIQKMQRNYDLYGFLSAFDVYRGYCCALWAMYGRDLPHPDSMSFGFIKLFASRWLWGAIPNFIKYQLRLVRG